MTLKIDWKAVRKDAKQNNIDIWNLNKNPIFDLAPYIYEERFSIKKVLLSTLLMMGIVLMFLWALDTGIRRCESRGYTFEQCMR